MTHDLFIIAASVPAAFFVAFFATLALLTVLA